MVQSTQTQQQLYSYAAEPKAVAQNRAKVCLRGDLARARRCRAARTLFLAYFSACLRQ